MLGRCRPTQRSSLSVHSTRSRFRGSGQIAVRRVLRPAASCLRPSPPAVRGRRAEAQSPARSVRHPGAAEAPPAVPGRRAGSSWVLRLHPWSCPRRPWLGGGGPGRVFGGAQSLSLLPAARHPWRAAPSLARGRPPSLAAGPSPSSCPRFSAQFHAGRTPPEPGPECSAGGAPGGVRPCQCRA
jgi:hypothetical protein